MKNISRMDTEMLMCIKSLFGDLQFKERREYAMGKLGQGQTRGDVTEEAISSLFYMKGDEYS